MPEKKKSFEFTGWYRQGNPGTETVGSWLLLTPSQWWVGMRGLPSWRLALGGTEKGSVPPQKKPVYWRLSLESGDSQMAKRKSCMPLLSLSVPISRPVTVTRKARREGYTRNHSQTSSRDQGSCGVPGATWSSKARTKAPSPPPDADKVTFLAHLANERDAFCSRPWV